jgi:hypothetical protein
MKDKPKPVGYKTLAKRIKKYYKDNYDSEIPSEGIRLTEYYQGYIEFFVNLNTPVEDRPTTFFLEEGKFVSTKSKQYNDGLLRALSDAFKSICKLNKVPVVLISRETYLDLKLSKWLTQCA